MAHDHVGRLHRRRDRRPGALDGLARHAAGGRTGAQLLEGVLALVDADDRRHRRYQRQRCRPAAAADVEHRTPCAERVEGDASRREVERRLVVLDREHAGQEAPRRLGSLLEDALGNGPTRQLLGPSTCRRTHELERTRTSGTVHAARW